MSMMTSKEGLRRNPTWQNVLNKIDHRFRDLGCDSARHEMRRSLQNGHLGVCLSFKRQTDRFSLPCLIPILPYVLEQCFMPYVLETVFQKSPKGRRVEQKDSTDVPRLGEQYSIKYLSTSSQKAGVISTSFQ